MPRKQQYSIGELSQLCNVSKKALRFYDKIGLISSLRHDYNNYRMYTHDELLLVPVLKYYKQMGFKLDEMRKFISGRNGNVYSALRAAFEQKLDELTTMTNDLSNFLSSTMIGILFVDSHLNIRKFTEYIGREFQLESQDVGRSMQIFAHSFPDEDIVTDARNVLKDLTPVDREVVGMNGRFYTMRIAPYRTTENSIRGLVITVIDSLGSSNERTRESDHETSSPEGA